MSERTEMTAIMFRCAEHEQGTNVIDRPPLEHEVCFGSFDDPVNLPCRWEPVENGSQDGAR